MPLPLVGTMTVKVLIDKKSIDSFKADMKAALELETTALLKRLGQLGTGLLAQMEMARGHTFLSRHWRYSPIKDDGDTMRVEIYSLAEDMTFYARAGIDRQPDTRYPIEGRNLMAILEGGARPHSITPRSPGGRLVFPVAGGIKTSEFGGTRLERAFGLRESSFLGPGPDSVLIIPEVSHPGVVGNRFIATTRLLLEQALSAQVQDAERRVVAKLS